MLNLYLTKVIDNALDYLPKLNLNVQQRILKNKKLEKQRQMISAELLLYYALKDSGYHEDVKTDYLPKLVLLNSNLHISKSHSHEYVMVAVSSANVGCDIEKLRTVKNPERLLAKEELKKYEKVIPADKKRVFTLYWTVKESFIKYHGTLDRQYKEIFYDLEKTINDFSAGKVDDLYCYQSFFNDYSIAVVTKEFTTPQVIIVNNNSIVNGE